ncbi:MAG: sodium:calcium antiporter [Patescibacteria group bacterium]
MDWILNLLLFLISCGLLYTAGEFIISGLVKLSRYLGLTEFVVAFFIMATAASLPNFFIGLSSALRGIPELSFGDVMGNNLVALTLAVGLAVYFAPKKEIVSGGSLIQTTLVFTVAAAVLPLILIADGVLSQGDGLILIGLFVIYLGWLFSKKERFTQVYEKDNINKRADKFLSYNIFLIVVGALLLLLAAQGIVSSAFFMATALGLPVVLIGLLVVGLGSAMPQLYFAVRSACYGHTNLILGNLMGSVIIPSSLVLGTVTFIQPIDGELFEFFVISRFFLILAILSFLVFTWTGKKIDKKESWFLLLVYLTFVVTVIFLI